jgi:lycopene cyclase CruA
MTLAPQTLEHVRALEAAFHQRRPFEVKRSAVPLGAWDTDVLQVGAGPALLHGILLAQQGWRVTVADRRKVGQAHREWNISGPELEPLVQHGVLTREQVASLVVAQYRHGIIHWHGGKRRVVNRVLDHALDAGRVMELLVARGKESGIAFLEGHRWSGLTVHPNGVVVAFETDHGPLTVTARLVLDATGSSSPFADFDLACPTVGGVMEGLEEGTGDHQVDSTVGEILVSTEGVEEGRQHIWEGFPASSTAYTVYLFYYEQPHRVPADCLQALYRRFFETLPRYKRGDARLLRPTYGIIPGHTRLKPGGVSPADRVLRVGDSAARQSPLTFCGFGSLVRSCGPSTAAVGRLLESNTLDQHALNGTWQEPPQLRMMGVLALMMMERGAFVADPQGVNRLLEVAFATLENAGPDAFERFVRDQATPAEVMSFLLRLGRTYPAVFKDVARNVSFKDIAAWTVQAGRALAGA